MQGFCFLQSSCWLAGYVGDDVRSLPYNVYDTLGLSKDLKDHYLDYCKLILRVVVIVFLRSYLAGTAVKDSKF
jgi:hypothetical protein